MDRYAQLVDNVVHMVIESDTDPDGINGEWIQVSNEVGPGFLYDGTNFTPPPPPPPVIDDAAAYIDIGPFNDRFGAKKLAILMSSDLIIRAFNDDKNSRHWIDLNRADVAAALNYMAGVTVPGLPIMASPILTTAEVQNILQTPVRDDEQLVLRKLYFPRRS